MEHHCSIIVNWHSVLDGALIVEGMNPPESTPHPPSRTTPHPPETGARARTRNAILDAAVDVLAADHQASLADVAAAAEVGRTTVHRYFPERADLIHAVVHHVVELSHQAIQRAEPDSGPLHDALRRVVEEHIDLGSILMYIFLEPVINADASLVSALRTMEEAIDQVLARPDAGLNPDFSHAWVRRTFWGLLYAGWETAQAGEMPRHQIVDSIITTLRFGVYDPAKA